MSGAFSELQPSKATVRIPPKRTPGVCGLASGPATTSNRAFSGAGRRFRRFHRFRVRERLIGVEPTNFTSDGRRQPHRVSVRSHDERHEVRRKLLHRPIDHRPRERVESGVLRVRYDTDDLAAQRVAPRHEHVLADRVARRKMDAHERLVDHDLFR